MRDFKEMDVWQRARRLAESLIRLTGKFSKGHLYTLAGRMRRAAISIAANIAEAAGRPGRAGCIRFLYIAMASACELESHLTIGADVGLIAPEDYRRLHRSHGDPANARRLFPPPQELRRSGPSAVCSL